MRCALIPAVVVALAAAPAFAASFTLGSNSYDVQFITSSGTITDASTANYALLALDFDSSHVYLFGYQWQTGSKTGYDLVHDIAANSSGALTYDVQFFGTDAFVGGFDYAGLSTTDNFDPANYSSWSYYTADGGNPFVVASTGASQRNLSNGSIDDWTLLTVAPVEPNFDPTRSPTALPVLSSTTATPLPAAWSMLSVTLAGGGAAAFLRKRKRAI